MKRGTVGLVQELIEADLVQGATNGDRRVASRAPGKVHIRLPESDRIVAIPKSALHHDHSLDRVLEKRGFDGDGINHLLGTGRRRRETVTHLIAICEAAAST